MSVIRSLLAVSVTIHLAVAAAALSLATPAAAQSSVRVPPASSMRGDIRRGRDGQIELIPGSDPVARGRARATTRARASPGPPPGTPWIAKTQQERTPQPRFEESDSSD
jgi:hypothetical protein